MANVDSLPRNNLIPAATSAADTRAAHVGAEDVHKIFQAGLALHNANLPIWDARITPRRVPANELINRLKHLSAAQHRAIYNMAALAEFGDGAISMSARPHRLMLGIMAHMAVVAQLVGRNFVDLVPRMAWDEATPRSERFVRLLLQAAGVDVVIERNDTERRIAQLCAMAEPIFKKRTGQGGLRELRALAQKIAAVRDLESGTRVEVLSTPPQHSRPLPLSPMRSPRTAERLLLGAGSARPQVSRQPTAASLPEDFSTDAFEVISLASTRPGTPESASRRVSPTSSEQATGALPNELVEQLRARYANSRRPSQLSLSSSWAGVSDERSAAGDSVDGWQDVEPPEA